MQGPSRAAINISSRKIQSVFLSLLPKITRECAHAGRTSRKGLAGTILLTLMSNGRRGGIRTRDPLHPMQVRYQAALHAEYIDYNVQSNWFNACLVKLAQQFSNFI